MKYLKQLTEKYNSGTVFVFFASIIVVFQLIMMQSLVPTMDTNLHPEEYLLMDKICTKEKLAETETNIEEWGAQTILLTSRLESNAMLWQKQLGSSFAFGKTEEHHEPINKHNQRGKYLAAANYAAENLFLQSIMTGRTTLANINGNIYREGDTILMRGGEIEVNIVELGTTYAVVQLANNDIDGDTKRTIYLTESMGSVRGGLLP